MEKDTDFQCNFINLREFLETHFWSFFQLSEHRGVMMIGMIESPILAEILYKNVPPLTTDKVGFLFFIACNRIDSFDHFHPDFLILSKFFNGESILCQYMSTNLS